MSIQIKTTTDLKDPARFLADAILRELQNGKKVLWLMCGGSSIPVMIEAAKIISARPHKNSNKNLSVTLTDERHGPVGHADSNWAQLLQKGFSLPEARLIPVLSGDDLLLTTEKFNTILTEEFAKAQYKIGSFGIGPDGHTSGILPESPAVTSKDLACGYETPKFSRITTTFQAIEQFDEAVVWVQGQEKWKVLEDLSKEIDIAKMPAQILKKIPLVTIFTDYKI